MTDEAAPIIKWAGGKTWMGPLLRETVGSELAQRGTRVVYVEPFAGALGSFCSVRPSHAGSAVVGDANPDLILLHTEVQRDPSGFHAILARVWAAGEAAPEGWARTFRTVRNRFNDPDHPFGRNGGNPSLRAAVLVWILRHSYNGLYRVNLHGGLNVPPADRPGPLPTIEAVTALAAALRNTVLVSGHYEALLDTLVRAEAKYPGVVYLDPPYLPPPGADAGFVSYTQGRFTLADQEALATLGLALAKQGWAVFASNHDTPEVHRIYQGWNVCASPERFNRISAGPRGRTREVLFSAGSTK